MAGWGAFVGRERELSRLRSALAERVRLVLVVGDAGIGKTRFVKEGLHRATAQGVLAVGGGCLPLTEKLSMLPVADAMAELSRLEDGAPFEAALTAAPLYVRPELARLMPRLASGEPAEAEPAEQWRHDRLFAGVAELLDGVARRRPLAVLVEDLHWADGATLDFLTYLVRPSRASAVSLVVTCRSDEVPLDDAVTEWLVHVRRDAGVAEIRLGPLSHNEVTEQITELVGAPPPDELVEEVYARAEGHPFFTEQLVAAAVANSGQLERLVALPARLAELLISRAARCGLDARAVLNTLAVAARPLTESMLGQIAGLNPETVRAAVRELATAQLLTAQQDAATHRLRHALLAEAVVVELLPGERVSLHERIARALKTTEDQTLAAEVAGHWAAAGRAHEELLARLTAARAAEQVFAYADAAVHWQRTIELYEGQPSANLEGGIDLPQIYLRAVDALETSGDGVRAGAVAEDAYRRFADHPDRAIAAQIHLRAARMRALDSPASGLPLIKEALRLYEGAPPSAEYAMAWYWYAAFFLQEAPPAEAVAAFERALEVAEEAGAATDIPRILCGLAYQLFLRGDVEDGFQLLDRAHSGLDASADAWSVGWLAVFESEALLKVGRLADATQVALRGDNAVRQGGLGSSLYATVILANAVDGLLSRGRTLEAAALIDPLTAGPIDRDNVLLHACRAEIDLLRGQIDAAAKRLAQTKLEAVLDISRELGQRSAEVALWGGRADEALEEVQRLLERLAGTEWVILCGWLLEVGMRACADLAEQGRAHRHDDAVRAALVAADDLVSWVDRAHDMPFIEHPFVAANPAARATWEAERGRAVGANDSAAWSTAGERWEALDYRHRAGYARWRQAEALLAEPRGGRAAAATVLLAAADQAQEHVPLMTVIHDLARRARIDLSAAVEPVDDGEPMPARAFGLTDRELAVLQLLGQGKTNPEIAAALFVSPRTVSVHVSNILRKLGVSTRVQAATIAERAGLLAAGPTPPAAT